MKKQISGILNYFERTYQDFYFWFAMAITRPLDMPQPHEIIDPIIIYEPDDIDHSAYLADEFDHHHHDHDLYDTVDDCSIYDDNVYYDCDDSGW